MDAFVFALAVQIVLLPSHAVAFYLEIDVVFFDSIVKLQQVFLLADFFGVQRRSKIACLITADFDQFKILRIEQIAINR